jgi:hypothetical protein
VEEAEHGVIDNEDSATNQAQLGVVLLMPQVISAVLSSDHCGGPAARCRRLVVCCPDGLTQVTDIVSPGWSRDRMRVRSSGEPTGCPFTAVMTAPPVMPAAAAGLPQMVPMTRAPELAGAMAGGTVRPELLV